MTEDRETGTRIVILGGGFAGSGAARELAALLDGDASHEITLVDQNDFFLFTPMLTEVAGGEVDVSDAIVPLRTLASRVRYRQAHVESIDAARRAVTLVSGGEAAGVPTQRETISADHLVIALGAVANFHHISGLADHALPILAAGDAEAIRTRALMLLERAREALDPSVRRPLLTIVVGGGGFSGVETMAALNDMVRTEARRGDGIDPDEIRTILIEPGDRLLPELDPGLARFATRELESRGVRVVLGRKVTGATDGTVSVEPPLDGASEIATYCLIWAGGITPNPVASSAGAPTGRHHGIVVDRCGRVQGMPGVWALGDCAQFPNPSGGDYAPTAQNASREGPLVARNIVAEMRGQPLESFDYHPIGQLAIVGRRAGVASIYGVHISGVLAWMAWRLIYLAKLPSIERRVQVGVSWLLDFLVGREPVALPGRVSPPAANQLANEQ